jgi:hypothetical protein
LEARLVWFSIDGNVLLAVVTCLVSSGSLVARSEETPDKVIQAVVSHEREAEMRRDYFSYISEEESQRTKGHHWMEKVVESADGKIRRLIAEDGKPLGMERSSKEMDRLKMLAQHSKIVAKEEQASKEDDDRLQRLLALLPRAFLFEDGGLEGRFRRIIFHPNPNFSPSSFEERVVHAMSGSILVWPQELRLHAVDARLTEDVTWGFGLLARLSSGGHVSMAREEQKPGEWKTTFLQTAFDGKVIFLKTINLRQNTIHRNFKPIPKLSVPQAVALVTRSSG